MVGRSDHGWTSPLTATQARISLARSLLLAGRPAECRSLLTDVERMWEDGQPPAPLCFFVHALVGLAHYRENHLDEARAHAALAGRARAACPAAPRPRAVPEYAMLKAALATRIGEPDALVQLRELVDSSPGLGPDRSMTAFASLILAHSRLAQHDRAGAAARVAAADAQLASLPSALGLIDFRNEVAALAGGAAPAYRAAELLSERELAVLQYLRSDLSLKEVAAHLYVSVNTVKTHTRHIYRKLGITGRHQLFLSTEDGSAASFAPQRSSPPDRF